jgi:uncharacterized protein
MKNYPLIFISILLSFVSPSFAQSHQHNNQLQNIIDTSNSNDSKLLYQLGEKYIKGDGVERNFEIGMDLIMKSAKYGYIDAQFSLGYIYLYVFNDEQNNKDLFLLAKEWFEKAANQGHIESQFFLGEIYNEGIIIEKDILKAKSWFRKSCNQGHEESCEKLY